MIIISFFLPFYRNLNFAFFSMNLCLQMIISVRHYHEPLVRSRLTATCIPPSDDPSTSHAKTWPWGREKSRSSRRRMETTRFEAYVWRIHKLLKTLENLADSFLTIFFKEWRRFISKMQSSPQTTLVRQLVFVVMTGYRELKCCARAILINIVMTWAIDNGVKVEVRRNCEKNRLDHHDIYWDSSRHSDKYELSFGKNPLRPPFFKPRTNRVFSGRQATGDGQVRQRLPRAIRIGQRWAPNSWSVWNSHNFSTCRNSMWG